jgi:hypothetical protein
MLRMSTMLWGCVLLTCAMGATGCTYYVPPALPPSESAKLTNGDTCIQLHKIDGQRVGRGRFGGGTILAPGLHDIDVFFEKSSYTLLSTRTLHADGQLQLQAEAGRDYSVRCLLVGYTMIFWIEDTVSGQTVAGAKPEVADTTKSPSAVAP